MARIINFEGRKISVPDDATDDEVASIISPESAEMTTAESVLSHPVARAGLGAASLLTGSFQLGANIGDKISEVMGSEPVVGKWTNEKLAQLEAIKRRGMAKRSGNEVGEDWDVAGGLGQMAGGVAALKNIPIAKTLGSKVLQGMATGGGLSAATPITSGEDNILGEKAVQTGVGTALGGAIPLAVSGAKELGRAFITEPADLFMPGGANRIAERYGNKLITDTTPTAKHDAARQKIIDEIRKSQELVQGSKPTLAEVVSNIPEGSPLQAQQAITSQAKGGVSAEFGKRIMNQETARKAAYDLRDELTTPMREKAISLANTGGVKSGSVLGSIDKIQSTPGLRASEVVGKTLASVKDKIAAFTKEDGSIDANDLYMIRKEIGNTIKTHSKETANFDKRLSAKLQTDIQTGIDDAIENAGGTGWRKYLSEFSDMTSKISKDVERSEKMYSPAQKTNLYGGVNVAEETRTHVPQMLSRPAMIVNAILRWGGKGIEPRLDRIMAEQQLNPELFARSLEKMTPTQRQKVVNALMQKATQTSPALVARGQGE